MGFFSDATSDPGFRTDTATATPLPPTAPETPAVIDSAFRQNNLVVSAYHAIANSGPFTPDPDHNPLDTIRGTPYERQHIDRFVGSRSEAETTSIMRRIDGEEKDRKTLEAAGVGGTMLSMLAGTVDPTLLLPGSIAVKAGREGYEISRAALSVGLAAGVQASVQEAGLQATQLTRPLSESVLNVGSATILGGILGAGAMKLLGPAERAVMERSLDRTRAEIDAHAAGVPAVAPAEPRIPGAPPLIPDAAAPSQVKLVKAGERKYNILDQDGNVLVTADIGIVEIGGKKLAQVDDINTPALEKVTNEAEHNAVVSASRNVLGTGQMREVMRQFLQLHPEVEGFTGNRVSGARNAGKMNSDNIENMTISLPASVSAAATDTRTLRPASSGIDKIPVLGGLVERLDPMSRVFGSESPSARRALADLAETPLRMEENAAGIPTTAGPALDRIARLEINQTRVAVGDELDRLFSEYRFGAPDTFAPRMRAAFENFTGRGEGKMTFEEFKKEVGSAMQNGDKHAIPQVEQAAQMVRARVFEPWKKRAIDAGLFPEDVAAKGAESYFQRVYNKQAIAAKRPDFVNRVTDYLASDQATKAAAKQRIEAYHGALTVAQDQIKKTEARIAKLEEDAEVIAARQEETTRLNKFAFDRSTNLRESEFKNDGGIRVADPGKNIEKARGGAVLETKVRNRGNELADRASGKLAEIDTLEQKLIKENANHDAMRAKIEGELAAWEGQSSKEAKAALKARADAEKLRAEAITAGTYKGKGGRLASADGDVDSAVRRILTSDREISRMELKSRADEITDRILGGPDGRLSYEMHTGSAPSLGGGGEAPRGPLAERKFAIPDQMIADYLEKDVEHVMNAHLRTMVPDVLLTERFGDTAMTEAFRKINDDYAAMAVGKSETALNKMEKERQNVIRDISAIRDRIRGVYGYSSDAPLRNAARLVAGVKNYNVLTSMGVAAVSSLPDMAGAVFRHGLTNVFSDAWAPWLRSIMKMDAEGAYKEAKAQFRAMGISTETTLATRQHALNDVTELYRPNSRLERTLQWGADKYQLVNLLAPWTDWGKTTASMVAGSEILRAARAVAEGKATKRQITNLAESGIDSHMAGRIHAAFTEGGEVRNGVHLPNTGDWKDLTARRAFEGAVAREADIAVITPGQEKPLWISHPVLGIFGQFKSFTAAATQRTLIANLQRHDAQTLQGLIFSIGLGMVSYKANSMFGGQPVSDRPQDWIKESISRGGLLGWLEEGNALAAKASGGKLDIYRAIGADKPLSRFASRSALDQILGPTAGKIDSLLRVTRAGAKGEWAESDTKALRRLMAFQNLFYLRRMFDQVEAGANHQFNVPAAHPKPEVHH